MTGPSFGLAARRSDRPEPVRAYNEAGESIEEPTGSQIDAMIAGLNLDCSFLIVERIHAPDYYIQAAFDPDLAFRVEYRDGDADHHFGVILPPDSSKGLAAIIRHWIDDDGTWRTTVPWEPVTFDSD